MAKLILKIIKSKAFETKQGVKGTFYTAAYKGRSFGVSTLSFEKGELTEDAKAQTLTISVDVEVVQTTRTDDNDVTTTFKSIVPKLDLDLALV